MNDERKMTAKEQAESEKACRERAEYASRHTVAELAAYDKAHADTDKAIASHDKAAHGRADATKSAVNPVDKESADRDRANYAVRHTVEELAAYDKAIESKKATVGQTSKDSAEKMARSRVEYAAKHTAEELAEYDREEATKVAKNPEKVVIAPPRFRVGDRVKVTGAGHRYFGIIATINTVTPGRLDRPDRPWASYALHTDKDMNAFGAGDPQLTKDPA